MHRRLTQPLLVCAVFLLLQIPIAGTARSQTLGPELPAPCTPLKPLQQGGCIVEVTPAVAVNALGLPHTATLTCDVGATPAGTGGPGLAAGCYNVSATVTDAFSGSDEAITSITCGGQAVAVSGGSAGCPIDIPAATPIGSSTANQVTVAIDAAAPHVYVITFTGYVLASCPPGFSFPATASPGGLFRCSNGAGLSGSPTCPPGTGLVNPVGLATSSGIVSTAGCLFEVAAEKKYEEAGSIGLFGGPCGGTLVAAGSSTPQRYTSPTCTLNATLTGTTLLAQVGDCKAEMQGLAGQAPPADFGPNATYQCTDGVLSVTGIPLTAGVNVGFTVLSGPGSFLLNGSDCINGTIGPTATMPISTTPSGSGTATATLCPTSPGGGAVQACIASTLNTQPNMCSNQLPFAFTPVDNTAPVIAAAVRGPAGNNGWYRGAVQVSWNVKDPESGIASSSGCDPTVLSSDTDGTTLTCTATNGQGLTSSQSVTVRIDATPPLLSPISSAAHVILDDGSVVTPGAVDALSGLATQSCTPLDVASVGTKWVTCTATDQAGNESRSVQSYAVAYQIRAVSFLSQGNGSARVRGKQQASQLYIQLQDAHGVNESSLTVPVTALCLAPGGATSCDGAPQPLARQFVYRAHGPLGASGVYSYRVASPVPPGEELLVKAGEDPTVHALPLNGP